MKYFLVQLVAVLPLLGLTVLALLEPARSATSPLAPEPGGGSAAAAQRKQAAEQCRQTEQMVQGDQPVVEQLLAANPLSPQPLTPGEPDEHLRETVAAWKEAERVRALAQEICSAQAAIARHLATFESPSEKDDAELKDWQEFLAAHQTPFTSQVGGALEARRAVEQHVQGLADKQAKRRQHELIAGALAKAEDCLLKKSTERLPLDQLKAFRQAQAAECLKLLDSDPAFKGPVDGASREQMDVLSYRAKYYQRWWDVFGVSLELPPATLPEERHAQKQWIRQRLTAMSKFLADYDEPPHLGDHPPDPKDANGHRIAREMLARLLGDSGIYALGDAESFADLLTRAEALLKSHLTAEQQEQLRREIGFWLATKGWPKIVLSQALTSDVQEAFVKPDQRRIGEFQRPLIPGAPWQYWKQPGARGSSNTGDEQIPREQFLVLPRPPRYVQWATAYQQLGATVTRTGATRADWSSAVQQLQNMQNELSQYRAHWNVSERNTRWDDMCAWSFDPAIRTGQEVLEHWDRYHRLLRAGAVELSSQ